MWAADEKLTNKLGPDVCGVLYYLVYYKIHLSV